MPLRPCANYLDYRHELEGIDEILHRSGLDGFILDEALDDRRRQAESDDAYHRGLDAFTSHTSSAFRIGILRAHKGCAPVRGLEITLADSPLEQWFCFIGNFDQIKAPGKSTVDRAKKLFTADTLDKAFAMLLQKSASAPNEYDPIIEKAINLLGFEVPTNLLEVWYDATCHCPNIHFPVDWVQLGDCCHTLLKAVRCIRKHGVKNRMPCGGPDKLLHDLNQLIIALAHERIIGERRVPNDEKILSIYETDTKVLVRGKSGSEVEYGNPLLLGENRDGLIVHWELFEQVRSDSKLLPEALAATEKTIGSKLRKVVTDRGFSDEKFQVKLAKDRPDLTDHICPRSPAKFAEKKIDPDFRTSQTRRAQTEARVAIITNNYQNGRSLSKGLESQRQELRWVMLAHNLRILSRRLLAERAARERERNRAA